MTAQDDQKGKPGIPIFIDDVKYDAPSDRMTGEALRNLTKPPVPAERNL